MKHVLPIVIPVRKTLKKIGADIRNARIRRRISTQLMADRMGTTRATLHAIEQGKDGVSMGMYAMAIYILGLLDNLRDVADIANDPVGQALDREQLPKRIRKS